MLKQAKSDPGDHSFNFSKGSGRFMGVNLDSQLARD